MPTTPARLRRTATALFPLTVLVSGTVVATAAHAAPASTQKKLASCPISSPAAVTAALGGTFSKGEYYQTTGNPNGGVGTSCIFVLNNITGKSGQSVADISKVTKSGTVARQAIARDAQEPNFQRVHGLGDEAVVASSSMTIAQGSNEFILNVNPSSTISYEKAECTKLAKAVHSPSIKGA
ncbi:MAG TPA: hypothetical protein VHB69_06980 [Mycobacteriales bacterium]|nr:hypothetical protein [Mycobacteriales bacterium]